MASIKAPGFVNRIMYKQGNVSITRKLTGLLVGLLFGFTIIGLAYYQVLEAKHHDQAAPEFPEKIIAQYLDNTWHDTAEAVINNWIGQVYQLTHMDRNKAFQDTINPDDPLGIRQA